MIQLSSNNAFRSTAYIPIKKNTLRNRVSSIFRKYMEEWEEMTRFAWSKPLQNSLTAKFNSNSYIYCISSLSVQYRQTHHSPVQYATGFTRRFCGKVRKIMVNLIKIS